MPSLDLFFTVVRAPGMMELKVSLSKLSLLSAGVLVWEWPASAFDEGDEAAYFYVNTIAASFQVAYQREIINWSYHKVLLLYSDLLKKSKILWFYHLLSYINYVLCIIIAELSTDLLDLFIQVPKVHRDAKSNNSSYLQIVAESLVLLLNSGANRELEIIEHV